MSHFNFIILVLLYSACSSNTYELNGIKKCCDKNYLFNQDTKQCEEMSYFSSFDISGLSNVPNYFDPKSNAKSLPSNKNLNNLGIGLPECKKENLIPLDMRNELDYLFTVNGTLMSLTGAYEISADLGDFCFDIGVNETKATSLAVICDPCSRPGVVCIYSKCTQNKGVFDLKSNTCLKPINMTEFNPPTWKAELESDLESDLPTKKIQNFYLVKKRGFTCPKHTKNPSGVFIPDKPLSFRLFGNGSVELKLDENTTTFQPPNTFIIGFENVSENGQDFIDEIFLTCVPNTDEVCYACIIYPICCTISNIFLILTFVTYIILPELRAPLFGKLIMIFIVALFLAYFFMAINAFGAVKPLENDVGCKLIGFLIQFFFLHAFFWMNILAYDMFTKFRKLEVRTTNFNMKQIRTLAFYALYGIGTPLVISAITLGIEYSPYIDEQFKPKVGERKCFFDQDQNLSSFLLHYLPLLLIQMANITFFTLTVFHIKGTWKSSKLLKHTNKKSNNYEHIGVVTKIFLIMGITWLFEFLSFLATWQWDKEIATNISYFNDVVNLLQGFFLFLILVCKPSVLEKLKSKFIGARDETKSAMPMTSSTASTNV